jgi:hypothetical protein
LIYISFSIFSFMFFFIFNDFFYIYLHRLVIYLIRWVHKFFDLHLWICLCQKTCWEIIIVQIFFLSCIGVFNLIPILIIFYFQFHPSIQVDNVFFFCSFLLLFLILIFFINSFFIFFLKFMLQLIPLLYYFVLVF